MNRLYKYDDGKIVAFEDGKEVETFKSLEEFLEDYDIIDELEMTLAPAYTDLLANQKEKEPAEKIIKEYALKNFTKFFKEMGGEAKGFQIDKKQKQLVKDCKESEKFLYDDIRKNVYLNVNKVLNKTVTGGDMFKNLKEAKSFTAHLDALANEIEALEGISTDMKKHLAYRLDRLSDLIEGSPKEASMEKEAIGVGSGAWAYDEDEAKYMSSFGGTGALKQDADEKYMAEFKGDDHKEVLERKENFDIAGDGKKVKQPSDDYNEKEVATKLKAMVKSLLKSK